MTQLSSVRSHTRIFFLLCLLRRSSAFAFAVEKERPIPSRAGAAVGTGTGTDLQASSSRYVNEARSNNSNRNYDSEGTSTMGGTISLRVARRTDVSAIQRCNLASLPENYTPRFYSDHLMRWPELALVAEHVPAPSQQSQPRGRLRNFLSNAQRVAPNGYDANNAQGQSRIIGYVLGKVEEETPRPAAQQQIHNLEEQFRLIDEANGVRPRPRSSRVQDDCGAFPTRSSSRLLGHVTSLAVLDEYRRKGLAANLMNQLHCEMKKHYAADLVGLHVRVSNQAATRLYTQTLGYRIDDIIPRYYQDGEDAYLMRKHLSVRPNAVAGSQELVLPRVLFQFDPPSQKQQPTPYQPKTQPTRAESVPSLTNNRIGTISFDSADTMGSTSISSKRVISGNMK